MLQFCSFVSVGVIDFPCALRVGTTYEVGANDYAVVVNSLNFIVKFYQNDIS